MFKKVRKALENLISPMHAKILKALNYVTTKEKTNLSYEDLKSIFGNSFFTNDGLSNTLKELCKKGYIEKVSESETVKRDCYTITKKGKRELQRA